MPEPGFRTITLSEDVYERLEKMYARHQREHLINPAITSLSLFFIECVEQEIKDQNAMRRFISKIKVVPRKFVESKLKIKIT